MASNNADFGCTFVVRTAGNAPYDLTGASLEMSLKNRAGQSAAATFASLGASPNLVIRPPGTLGIVDLSVPFATMATLSAGLYFWDLLDLAGSTSRLFLGGGTFLVTQGITESPTPALPAPALLYAAAGSDLSLTVPGQSVTLTLAPQGPAGSGALYLPQSAPAAPPQGFLLYCDSADGLLKAVSANGNITELALP